MPSNQIKGWNTLVTYVTLPKRIHLYYMNVFYICAQLACNNQDVRRSMCVCVCVEFRHGMEQNKEKRMTFEWLIFRAVNFPAVHWIVNYVCDTKIKQMQIECHAGGARFALGNLFGVQARVHIPDQWTYHISGGWPKIDSGIFFFSMWSKTMNTKISERIANGEFIQL